MTDFTLSDLEAIVAKRAAASPDESWTAKLVASGMEKAAKKLGEEADPILPQGDRVFCAFFEIEFGSLQLESDNCTHNW